MCHESWLFIIPPLSILFHGANDKETNRLSMFIWTTKKSSMIQDIKCSESILPHPLENWENMNLHPARQTEGNSV